MADSTESNSTSAMLMRFSVLAEITFPNFMQSVARLVLVRFIALESCGCCCCKEYTLDIDTVLVGSSVEIWFMAGTVGSVVTQLMDLGSTSSVTAGVGGECCLAGGALLCTNWGCSRPRPNVEALDLLTPMLSYTGASV